MGLIPGNPRNKTALAPGHSLMDWIRLGNSGKDLSGVGGKLLEVSPGQLLQHNTKDDAWIAIHGKLMRSHSNARRIHLLSIISHTKPFLFVTRGKGKRTVFYSTPPVSEKYIVRSLSQIPESSAAAHVSLRNKARRRQHAIQSCYRVAYAVECRR